MTSSPPLAALPPSLVRSLIADSDPVSAKVLATDMWDICALAAAQLGEAFTNLKMTTALHIHLHAQIDCLQYVLIRAEEVLLFAASNPRTCKRTR